MEKTASIKFISQILINFRISSLNDVFLQQKMLNKIFRLGDLNARVGTMSKFQIAFFINKGQNKA